MHKQVVITINRDGTSSIDAQNFQGVGCKEATKMIEVALGGNDPDNRDEKKKPEFYGQTNTNHQTIKR